MIKKTILKPILFLFFLIIYLLFNSNLSIALEISGLNIKIADNEISSDIFINPDTKFIEDINSGLTKELHINIDLFRGWDFWPNEFITGKKFIKILKGDPIKKEFIAESISDNIATRKRFNNALPMYEWAMNLTNIKLTNTKNLEEGRYFVKVTIKSIIRKLPPVIEHLLFFVSDKEFIISKMSETFKIPKIKIQK